MIKIKDFRFIYINNNNNTVIGAEEEPIPPVDECAEADDIEACFEEYMLPEDFETLSAALQRGLNVEINDNPSNIKQFCRYLKY
jgi:hypothetical protein